MSRLQAVGTLPLTRLPSLILPSVLGDLGGGDMDDDPEPAPKPKAAAAAPTKGGKAASGKVTMKLSSGRQPAATEAEEEAGASSGEEEDDVGIDLFADGKRSMSKRQMRKLGIRPQLWKASARPGPSLLAPCACESGP